VAGDVGCIDARSVVVTAAGVHFQARAGLALLSRALEVSLLGDPVTDTIDVDSSTPTGCQLVLTGRRNAVASGAGRRRW
jgi:hypothetical protein